MKKARLLLFVAAATFAAASLFAGGLEKYKLWPNSPQGYFMTRAERAEWNATVKTDADAEQFVNQFLAKRGPGFAEYVAQAADAADKHLTVAGSLGSRTLRGKVVILLGPPAGFSISKRQVKGSYSATGTTQVNAASGGGGGMNGGGGGAIGISAQDMTDIAFRQGMDAHEVNDYIFTYPKDALPIKQAKDLQVKVEVEPTSGTDRITDRRLESQLDDLFEAAAQAKLAAAAK